MNATVLPQAAPLGIHFFISQHTVKDAPPWRTWLRTLHWWRKVGKAQRPRGFEPTTSLFQGMCSTSVLQPRPMRTILVKWCSGANQERRPAVLKISTGGSPGCTDWGWPTWWRRPACSFVPSCPTGRTSRPFFGSCRRCHRFLLEEVGPGRRCPGTTWSPCTEVGASKPFARKRRHRRPP